MKKILILILIVSSFLGCKKETERCGTVISSKSYSDYDLIKVSFGKDTISVIASIGTRPVGSTYCQWNW
jgi:hypothetical protein